MPSNTGSPIAADIRAAAGSLRGLIAGLEPRDVPLPHAPDVLAAFTELERLAGSGRVLMTARAADAGVWERERFASPADWLAAQQGTTTGRARADLETSERLGELDATADAVRAGVLSPEQAGAVADAAAVNPAAEADLLERAQKDSLRRTRQEAERRKAEVRSEEEKAERDRKVRAEREVRFWYGNGAGNMAVRGPVADLKELEAILQREVDKMFRANRTAEARGTRGNCAFDALMDLGRSDATAGGAKQPSRPGRAPVTRLTLVRVDLGALMRGHTQVGEICEIGGVAVSVAELRRVLGDSITQLVLTNGEAVIDVVNLARKPTVAQMVAKLFTDATCCVEGCDRAVRLEFDHRIDWVRVHTTELTNLELKCDHHHDLKTHENWQLVAGTGRRAMVPPGHPQHPGTTPPVRQGQRRATASSADDAESQPHPRPKLVPPELLERARAARHNAHRPAQGDLFDTG